MLQYRRKILWETMVDVTTFIKQYTVLWVQCRSYLVLSALDALGLYMRLQQTIQVSLLSSSYSSTVMGY